jgi:hypothetical protein
MIDIRAGISTLQDKTGFDISELVTETNLFVGVCYRHRLDSVRCVSEFAACETCHYISAAPVIPTIFAIEQLFS